MARSTMLFSNLSALVCLTVASACGDDALERKARWSQPTAADVKIQLDGYLADIKAGEDLVAAVGPWWPVEGGPETGPELLDAVAMSIAAVDPRAQLVVDAAGRAEAIDGPASFDFFVDQGVPPFARDNLQLWTARELAQNELFDESQQYLEGLDVDRVVDPASLLFYRAVNAHWLMDKETCLPAVSTLLQREDELPTRYVRLAKLMEADLKPLKVDSLDEIARLMNDIRRRLSLARAGKKVRKQEEDVIAKLDKMIKKLEEQQQQQQQQSSSSSGGMNPAQPMQDSRPGGGTGEGNVDRRNIGNGSGWGNLPPKQRQEALQQIGKDYPSHYRDVIEDYFRALARDQEK